ncbi:glycosyltransferase family 2 protein [Pseudomonas sp. ABC1]|uniref:glycosyltransferase family 2 protein n=1 Tax=Pseudomonas sp. ABC1 TaxID=2748080 RepID=UPI0015C2F9D7|nr:glycosyltransferase family A protein [Pseudomonas sp. ABC1]QLF94152.1 glycosyltransferase family 2 protein [Pseudomonas sp. ABC1]
MSDSQVPQQPLITVVIPAYNYASTLARAAQSVLGQLDENSELLIIDDGSSDATPDVIDALKLGYPERFRSIRKENGGLASVRNLGIAEARGEWLVFLDADDQMAGGALQALQVHIAAHPETRMVIGGHVSVFEDGRRRSHAADPVPDEPMARVRAYLLDKRLAISNGACAMHRDVFSSGNYPEHFRNSEDIPVFAQVLARYPVSRIDAVLALIYKHGDSLRHHTGHGRAVGTQLVDEVFRRLPDSLQGLRQAFHVQRCLSLFRSAYLMGDTEQARQYFCAAITSDWSVLFNFSYSRKALRLFTWRR